MRIIRKRRNILKDSKGQAVLEYVLLAVMMFIVLYAIIFSIAQSTKKFANNYFGAYFQCLLELGELPSLGSDSSPETECDDLYEPFTVAAGRPLKFDSTGGNSDGSNNGASDSDSSNENADNNSSGNGDDQASSSGTGESATNSIAGGGSFGGFEGRVQKVPLSAADKKQAANDADGLAGAPSGTNNFQEDGFGSDGSGRTAYVPIYGSKKLEDEEQKKSEAIKANIPENPEQVLRGKRVPVSVAKPNIEEQKDENYTFPDIIRILIITAIILVIVIFFGGQVMQYNKSQGGD